jgi:L-rhamnose-H+ transport protein
MNAGFAMPMKASRGWAWENMWLGWTLVALIVLPISVTLGVNQHVLDVYLASQQSVLFEVIAFGAGWGLAQILFGLAIDSIGVALTFSLVLGTSAAVGTLIPLLQGGDRSMGSRATTFLFAGLILVLGGVATSAFAGTERDKKLHPEVFRGRPSLTGLVMAILCGLGASFVNLGLAFGEPLVARAAQLGNGPLTSSNLVWLPLMLAGAIPNTIYCLYRIRTNRSEERFIESPAWNMCLCSLMGSLWFGSTLLYGVACTLLGSWGAVLAWPVFMSLIVICATVFGIAAGEWRLSGKFPLRLQWTSVLFLVLAVFMLAEARGHLN